MASSTDNRQLQKLRADNKRLRADNKALQEQLAAQSRSTKLMPLSGNPARLIGVILCIGLAAALLVVGNILFWTGNTIVKTDRYVEVTAPIIKNAEVQDALAANVTKRLFEQVDITQITQEALPPRAAFLAPTIAEQLEQHTDEAVKKVLQRPQFQERWNSAQERAHQRFIAAVEAHGRDGSIDISEIYTDVSQQLKGTNLAFLADKPLPAKVGNVQLVSGTWLTALQRTIENIDTWRVMTLLLIAVFSVLGVWLSRNRRKAVVVLGTTFALCMFATIAALRIGREILTTQASPQNAAAAKEVYAIVTQSLVVQTWTILAASLLIVFVAWISGASKSSRVARTKIDQLFSGKLHSAIFGEKENRFTLWLGAHKRTLQWLIIALAAALILFIRLTPMVLLTQFIVVLLLILVVEVLAAKTTQTR